MNKLIIIGNLTRDPESRVTATDRLVCNFTVAVNRRGRDEQQADYFRVSVWDEMGRACQKYLAKGRKVAVAGRVTASAYAGNDGTPRASLEVAAQEVEFLTPRSQEAAPVERDEQTGFVKVEDEELPF
jgi:single-strand DNA-binding protein